MLRLRGLALFGLAVLASACSTSNERSTTAAPAAPTGLAVTAGAASTPATAAPPGLTATARPSALVVTAPRDVLFPARNDSFDFRSQLEVKYRDGLRRASTSTFVDNEGDVVWNQEYFRYRVNGCDHATAVQKVFTEIDGGAAPAVCGSSPSGLVSFPPRNEPLDFRRQLETKYQTGLRRSAVSTFVDLEGDIVWTQEYLRYRTNACDHATSVNNVLTQINGGAAPAVCFQTCEYALSPFTQAVSAAGGTFTTALTKRSGTCSWSASVDQSFVSVSSPTSGSDSATLTYTVAANTSTGARTANLGITSSGGPVYLTISQDGAAVSTPTPTPTPTPTYQAGFQMFDYALQVNAVTECQIRSATGTATTCTFTATSGLPTQTTIYDWLIIYTYAGTRQYRSQRGSSATFTITETCGQVEATAAGAVIDMSVVLAVTDAAGNTVTVLSGAGTQPTVQLRAFTCGS